VDIYLCEPVGPFPTGVGAAFNAFTTKQDVSPKPLPVIPAGKLRRGSKISVRANGEFSTTGTPTLSIGIYIATRAAGSPTDLAISSAITTGSGAAAWPWSLEWDGILNADPGTASSIQGQGSLLLGTALTTLAAAVPIPISAALRAVAIDTTIERAIGVNAAWSASSASNSITVYDLRVVILN